MAKMLYGAGGKAFITAPAETKAKAAAESIKASAPSQTVGDVDYIVLDYADLTAVKASVV
jgi:hypothetical protein